VAPKIPPWAGCVVDELVEPNNAGAAEAGRAPNALFVFAVLVEPNRPPGVAAGAGVGAAPNAVKGVGSVATC
jgi:hypothetical protein